MDPIIGRTEERLEFLSADDHVRRLADARDKALRDWNSSPFVAEVTGLSTEAIEKIKRASL